MHILTNKQCWFICLMMIGFMAWSSIAFAFAQHTRVDQYVQQQHLKMMVYQDLPKHAHDMADCPQHQVQITQYDVPVVSEQHGLHENCQDCVAHLCQNIWSCLDLHAMVIQVPTVLHDHRCILNSQYLIHFSKGYQRDLLRPPQT